MQTKHTYSIECSSYHVCRNHIVITSDLMDLSKEQIQDIIDKNEVWIYASQLPNYLLNNYENALESTDEDDPICIPYSFSRVVCPACGSDNWSERD